MFGVGKAAVQAVKGPVLEVDFTGATIVETNTTITDIWTMTDDGSILTASGALNPNVVLSSPDGTTWTERTTSFGSTTSFSASDGSTHVHAQLGGLLALESTDPESNNWNSRTVYGSGSNFTGDFIYDATTGLFITCGTNLSSARLATSPDGITWTERTVPAAMDNILSIYRSSNNTLVAAGVNGAQAVFITSTDGITWSGSVTNFDSGANDNPRHMMYDSVRDLHLILTDTELGSIGNNSGPPNTADFTEIGTNEGDGNANGRFIQANPGGAVVWSDGAGPSNEVRWTNDWVTVESFNPTEIEGILYVHYSTVDNEYYAMGRINGPTRGRIIRLT